MKGVHILSPDLERALFVIGKAIVMDVKKGKPLGHPDNVGKGDADPQQAGAEGGSGFIGDQRQPAIRDDGKNTKEPPLDGTMTSEDIEGDTDNERPGAH